MSTEIEQRVVQMKFDNQQFESGTKTTLSSLEKLKQSLRFENVQDGFSRISSAAKSVDMNSLGNATETVKMKFSALEVMAMTALSNITTSAMNTGKKLISAFTIDPIKSGFQEYETQMNAVQTILANTSNKGSTLDDVNKSLAELNTYADKTIYNFTEMTRNIGTFTAAGVGLETSTKAIKGIANLAAVSGSTSQQASTAMYQLSQALAAGKVSLQDWNSVVNAGMGGEIFQEELKSTARNFGIDVDGMIAKYGSFRESLTEGAWLTSDVLTATLQKFTGDLSKEELMAQGYTEAEADRIVQLGQTANDAATKVKTFTQLMDTLKEAAQSGWTQTWQILLGDFEEAKALFTGISDVVGGQIQKMSDARNNLLQGWKDLGGRTELIAGITNVLKSLGSVIGAVKKAFTDIFPGPTAQQLFNATKGFRELTERLKLSENTISAVTNVFKGLFSVLKIVVTALTLPLKFIPGLISLFSSLGTIVTKIAGLFGFATSGILEFASGADILNLIGDKIASIFNKVCEYVLKFVNTINIPMSTAEFEKLFPVLEKVRLGFTIAKESVIDWSRKTIEKIKETSKEAASNGGLAKVFVKMKDTLSEASDSMIDKLTSLKNNVSETSETVGDKMKAMKDSLSEGFGRTLNKIASGLSKVGGAIKNFFKGIDWTEVIQMVTGFMASKFFLDFGSFLKNAGKALDNLSGNFTVLSDIKDSVCNTIDGIRTSFESYQKNLKADMLFKIGLAIAAIAGSVYLISTIDIDDLIPALAAIGSMFAALTASMSIMSKFAGGTKIKGLVSMATSLLILSVAVEKLSGLDTKDMFIAIGAVATLMTTIGAYSVAMNKMGGSLTTSSLGLIAFAGAVLVLTSAIQKLVEIPGKQLAVGLAGVMALSTTVAISNKVLGSGENAAGGAVKLLAFASSIKTLAKVVKILADLSWSELLKGLVGVGALLAGLAGFTKLLDDKRMISTSTGMIILAGALLALTVPIKMFSVMKWSTFLDGLAKTAASLVTLGLSMKLMPKNLLSTSTGLLIVANSLIVMAGALKLMATMTLGEICKSLITLGGSLTALSLALRAMTGTISGSAALLVASNALVVLGSAMKKLGEMTWGEIIRSIVMLAGSLGVLTAAMYALAPLAPILLTISGAIALFSGSLVLLGVGLTGISAGITALAAALASGGAMIGTFVTSLGVVLASALTLIVKMIPSIAKAIGEAIVTLVTYLGECAPKLVEAGVNIFMALLEGAKRVIPQFADTVVTIIDEVLKTVAGKIQSITESIVKILIGLINGISLHLPELIDAVVDLMVNLFKGAFDRLAQLDFETIVKTTIGVGLMTGLFVVLGKLSGLAPLALKGVLSFGSVVAALIGVLTVVGGITQIPGVEWLMGKGADALAKVGEAIGTFVGKIIGGIGAGITSMLPEMGKDLSEFAKKSKPFFDLCNNINPETPKGVMLMTGAITLLTADGIVNGISKFLSFGKSPLVSFGKDIAEFAPYFKRYADAISSVNPDVVEKTSNALLALGKFANIVPNKGGLVSLFTGDNTLTDFAQELTKFGPALSRYSQSIQNVDATAVEKTSIAVKSLAEMAKLVPNKGGLVSLFTGDNTLSGLAEDLTKFGPAMGRYSKSIASVDPESVTKTSTAVKSLIELSKIVPNKGGLVSLFTGDNTLSGLAEDLAKFGPAMAKYSKSVEDVSTVAVNNSVNACKKLLELQALIPDDNNMSSFSKAIKDLGSGYSKYYDKIEEVESASVYASISCIKSIINLFKDMSGINYESIQAFVTGVETMGKTSVNKFISAFTTAGPSVEAGINSFFNTVTTTIQSHTPKINMAGQKIVDALCIGIRSKLSSVNNAISTLMIGAFTNINSYSSLFISGGVNIVTSIINGINGQRNKVINAITTLLTSSVIKMQSYYNNFVHAGEYLLNGFLIGVNKKIDSAVTSVRAMTTRMANVMSSNTGPFINAGRTLIANFNNGIISMATNSWVHCLNIARGCVNHLAASYWQAYQNGAYMIQGFCQGIYDQAYQAAAAARYVASVANNSFRAALQIHSPSRVMMEAGKYFDLGFVKGLKDSTKTVVSETEGLGFTIIDAIKATLANIPSILDEDMEFNPVITPVLDLDNIKNVPLDFSTTFSNDRAVEISRLNNLLTSTPKETANVTNVYQNFEQNNYSPKALSAVEIYRNTKNQFSRLKK